MNNPAKKSVSFYNEKNYILDDYGFLDDPELWDENFAEGMARLHGIYNGLTKKHWEFIYYIREKYEKEKDLPLLTVTCSQNNFRLGTLKSLFPTGYFRGACKIAGLSYKFLSDVNIWHTYETTPGLQQEYGLTTRGFLKDIRRWDERFANLIADEWNLASGLTDRHWDMIHFLRDYYTTNNNIPTVFELCQALELDLNDLKELFPKGYRRGACLIAGLPFFG